MNDLRLRKIVDPDFEAFHAIVSDFDVVKMLASWPWPSGRDFTWHRMNTPEVKAAQVLAIEVDGQFAGSIGGFYGGLGYMLDRRFWGRGITTWAVREMLSTGFRNIGLGAGTCRLLGR